MGRQGAFRSLRIATLCRRVFQIVPSVEAKKPLYRLATCPPVPCRTAAIDPCPDVRLTQIPMLEYGAPDYEQYGEVCGSEGPDGGEWAC